MLGKLFKHEFKNTGKVLLPLDLALIGFTIIGMLALGMKIFGDGNSAFTGGMALVGVAMLIFYILGIVALFIVTYVFLMIRFYRSMYSSEGYLTHTLPVSPLATLNTKLIVSVFWTFLTMLLAIGSIFALIFTTVKAYAGDVDFSTFWSEFETLTGLTAGQITGWSLLFMLVSSISGLLMIYCSISIGQLFDKYKVLAAIVTYVIIYIIMQIISLIYTFQASLSAVSDATGYYSAGISDYGSFTFSLVQSAILSVIFYVVTAYIGSKKVNLD